MILSAGEAILRIAREREATVCVCCLAGRLFGVGEKEI